MSYTTVSALHRVGQSLADQLARREPLQAGLAYANGAFAGVADVNQLREVTGDDEADFDAWMEEADRFFQDAGAACGRVCTGIHQPPARLAAVLANRQYVQLERIAWRLSQWKELAGDPARFRILPARAMRAAFRQVFLLAVADLEALADAWSERLDTPSLDMFVAMEDGQPVGFAGLYQVGDIGYVVGPVATGEPAAATALLAHALSLAKRLTLPTVVAATTAAEAEPLLESAGFRRDGHLDEFLREGATTPLLP